MLRGLFRRSKAQQRRQRFLQGLSIERLESRQLLYGVTDTPHGAVPGHDLGDTIQADVLIYSDGALIDLPANLGVTSGEDSAFVTTSGVGSTVSIAPADIDGDDLSYSITGGSDITAILSGSGVSFSAPANYNGSEEFSVSVTDGEYTDSQSITVTVNPVNDAPVANAASGETAEDQSVVVSLSGSDIDGDNLSFSLDADATNGSVTLDGSLATYTPNANYNGDDSFSFSISDGSESSSASVSLSVSAVNDAPTLAFVSDVSFDEDGSGEFSDFPESWTSLWGSDIDGDALFYSITGGSDITALIDGAAISFSAPENYNGSEEFSVSVSDDEYTDSQSITVTVNPVNDAPVATTGLSGTTALGSETVKANADITITTLDELLSGITGVNVWGLVDTSQTPNYTEVSTSQTPNWSEVA